MANAAFKGLGPARILALGYPGAAKTGSIAALANVGFKVRVLAFDKWSNMTPLIQFTKPEYRKNIDIVSFEDALKISDAGIEVQGGAKAFANAFRQLDDWQTTDENGVEMSLGPMKNWGMDTIVVIDTLTSMGDAAYNRALKMSGSTPRDKDRRVYGLAQTEQMNFLNKITSDYACHVIVNSHLKMIGPKDIERSDSEIAKRLKEEIAELSDVRLYPSSIGVAIAPYVGGKFSTTLMFEVKRKGGREVRVINSAPRAEVDLKIPALDVPADLPAESGYITVFEAITPGIARCLEDHGTPFDPVKGTEK